MYHYHLGLAYLKNGDKDKARQSLKRALSLNPSFDGAAEAEKALATL
jgi:Tfp pilus assembly protein PilF